MRQETFAYCVHRPRGVQKKLRSAVRSSLLSVAGTFRQRESQKRALRFLMAHYVFDDQYAAFARQIDMLRGMGDFVSTGDAVSMLRGEARIDGNYFHLSFDDGLDCLARNAVPVLDEAQIPALVFVNSALAGTPTREERLTWEKATNYAAPLRVMDWQTLARTGLEVGAHTRTHVRLSDISQDGLRLKQEIAGCKREIEAALGRPCRYFAWPFGQRRDFDEASMAAIQSAGFDAAFGAFRAPVKAGRTDLFLIPRHHFEPHWPKSHLRFFAFGGLEGVG